MKSKHLMGERMKQEALECTFKPKINDSRLNISYDSSDIHHRNLVWQQNKMKKIDVLKREHEIEELNKCTFAP